MACLKNLVYGLAIGAEKYRYLPTAQRYFDAPRPSLCSRFLILGNPVGSALGYELPFP
jgi:hypothetical protein